MLICYVQKHSIHQTLILTDSLSSIKAITNPKPKTHLNILVHNIQKTLLKLNELEIILAWIPSHHQIPGNDTVDELAKTGAKLNIQSVIKIPYTDYFSSIKQTIQNQWQEKWDKVVKNKTTALASMKKKKLVHHGTRCIQLIIGNTSLY